MFTDREALKLVLQEVYDEEEGLLSSIWGDGEGDDDLDYIFSLPSEGEESFDAIESHESGKESTFCSQQSTRRYWYFFCGRSVCVFGARGEKFPYFKLSYYMCTVLVCAWIATFERQLCYL